MTGEHRTETQTDRKQTEQVWVCVIHKHKQMEIMEIIKV